MNPASSIAGWLRNGFVLLAVLLGAAAAAATAVTVHQYQITGELTSQRDPLLAANVELREHFASSVAGLSGYLLTGGNSFRIAYAAARGGFMDSLSAVRRLAPPGLQGEVTAQARQAAAWYRFARRALAEPPDGAAAARLVAQSESSAQAFLAVNAAVQARLAAQASELIKSGHRPLLAGLAVSGALLLLFTGLALAGSLRAIRRISRPLHGLSATLRRLASGEHAARAEVSGPAEVREVALAVNALADRSDRLRREEQEHARLRAAARDAGNRIREHLRPDDVIREAHAAIEHELDCDFAFVQLITDGMLGSPENYNRGAPLPPDFLPAFPPDTMDWLADLYRRGANMLIQDLAGPEGEAVPSVIREPLLRLGIVSHLARPFGIGSEALGLLTAERTGHGRPWTAAEVDAFESIAADVGRGLSHARLYEAENRLVDDLKSLDRAKSGFLATVSHELRTPLTSITGYVELLRDREAGPISPDQDLMLDTIHRNAALLRNLIENVLTISKIELGVSGTVAHPVNLADANRAAVAAMEPVAETGGIALEPEFAGEPLMVNADPSQLDRVLMNLLSNAVKFTPRGGKVTVTAARDAGSAVVRVSDTGIGIPEKDMKDLFTRFFRASNVVMRAVPGTGLGLSVSHAIVADHGGDLTVDSREGVGTTVTVRLPLLDDQRGAGQRAVPGERS